MSKVGQERVTDAARWVEGVIRDFVESPENNMGPGRLEERSWDAPLVGFAKGDDPLWPELKKDIGDFYWTPLEIFAQAFPGTHVKADELTVITWVLPQTKATKRDHRKENAFPCERWARTRKFGEDANVRLRDHVAKTLNDAGYAAVGPSGLPTFGMKMSEKYNVSSPWSERHAAYASGLGTFGLCDGHITRVGKAVRCGSVVARISIPASKRPYSGHHEYCLFFADGTCGKCMTRCPVGALSASGHDKTLCRAYIDTATKEYIRSHYEIEIYGCGLCQVDVPCESRIPARRKNSDQGRREK